MPVPSIYEHVLRDWQRRAVDAWREGDGTAAHRGTLEVFTGGGKTLMALAAYQLARRDVDALRLAVVVPTAALQAQWLENIRAWLDIPSERIGRLGDGASDTFEDKQALVAVINTAADRLPQLADGYAVMLVVDECHRAGAPKFSRVLTTRADYRLGLSATPERVETDEHGLPIPFEDQPVARQLGRVVHRYTLKDARECGWLPTYRLVHHGVELTENEQPEYDRLSRRITDLQDQLGEFGVSGVALTRAGGVRGETAELINALRGLTGRRKDLLYRATERGRVAERVVRDAEAADADARILLFHERVAEAEALYAALRGEAENPRVVLEHSGLPTSQRRESVARFRSGASPVLVSVKSLVEGLDVPEASVGVSVAASASVRQRIQTLGRVLRRDFGENPRDMVVHMHVLYVRGTVDEAIYEGEDWEDLTGKDSNEYLTWAIGANEPTVQAGPPRTPRLTEEQAHEALGATPTFPQPWLALQPALEYSVSTRGSVTTEDGTIVANPQGVGKMVESVRGEPGGRFRVSDQFRYVVVGHRGGGPNDAGLYVAGRLEEPFRAVETMDDAAPLDVADLEVGDALPAQPDKAKGSYKIRSKMGGVIERRVGRDSEFALDEGEGDAEQQANRILDAWRALGLTGMTFHVSSDGIAWYVAETGPSLLASVTTDLKFPSDSQGAGHGDQHDEHR